MKFKPGELPSEEFQREVARLGRKRYEALKTQLESEHEGKYIAIHVDSGDYRIADSTSRAAREMEQTHPTDGRLYMRRIGQEPEWGLAARIIASDLAASRK